jgi:hypothetical protein
MVPSWLLLCLHNLQREGVLLTENQKKLLRKHSRRLQRLITQQEWNWGMRVDLDNTLKRTKQMHNAALVGAWEKATRHLPICSMCRGQEWPRCSGEFGCDWMARTDNKAAFNAAVQAYEMVKKVLDAVNKVNVDAAWDTYRRSRL